MRKLVLASIGISGLLLCGASIIAPPALAQATATSQAAAGVTSSNASQQAADDPDRIVCKSGPPPTGTLIGGSRECHTQREWDRRMHEEQQELTRQQINRGCTSGGC